MVPELCPEPTPRPTLPPTSTEDVPSVRAVVAAVLTIIGLVTFTLVMLAVMKAPEE